MGRPKQLRPVQADEKAPPQSVSEAAESGTRLDELRAMRRIIAAHLDSPNTLARDIAALSRRQIEISKEIETLEIQEAERAAADELGGEYGDSDAKWRPQAI